MKHFALSPSMSLNQERLALGGVALLSVGAMLAGSLSYALGVGYVKRTFAGIPPLAMAIGQQTAAATILLPLAAASLLGGRPSVAVALSVLGLALLSTAVAYLLYFRLIGSVGWPRATLTRTPSHDQSAPCVLRVVAHSRESMGRSHVTRRQGERRYADHKWNKHGPHLR
jgi:drug/metabolite transporter (DMT)-like permease